MQARNFIVLWQAGFMLLQQCSIILHAPMLMRGSKHTKTAKTKHGTTKMPMMPFLDIFSGLSFCHSS